METTAVESEASLTQLVNELLPPGWRHDVRVERVMGALTVLFADEQGHRHAFDVRPIDGETRAPVSGARLAYSYKEVDPEVDALDLLDAYREALNAFAAREDELLPWMFRPPAVNDECFPASEALREVLVAALPEPWRNDVEAYVTVDGFELRFRDGDGLLHGFNARRAGDDVAAFVRGVWLAFAYAVLDARVDSSRWTEQYREALGAFVAREAAIVDALRASIAFPTERAATTPGIVPAPVEDYSALVARTDCLPAPEALTERLTALVPEPWRHEVTVSLIADGFVLRLRDGDGRAHGFEARRHGPTVRARVRGEKLGFAYERHASGADLNPFVDSYDDFLKYLGAHEAELAALLDAALEPPPPISASEPGPGEVPAPAELTALLRQALPGAAGDEVAVFVVTGESVCLRAKEATGVVHSLDLRRLERNQPSMMQGRALGYSYVKIDPHLDEAAAVPTYREIFERFIAFEDEIVAHFDALGVA